MLKLDVRMNVDVGPIVFNIQCKSPTRLLVRQAPHDWIDMVLVCSCGVGDVSI